MSNHNAYGPLPSVFKPIIAETDPKAERAHYSDALLRDSAHRPLETFDGRYLLCMETGQLVREAFTLDTQTAYDQHWQNMQTVEPPADWKVKRRAQWLRQMEPYRKTNRLFEVGCGQGMTLRAATQSGWQAEGSEVAPTAAKMAEDFSNAHVHIGLTETMKLDEGQFDVVLCDNVFEHFNQPSKALEVMTNALRPGGVIYVQTLNSACWSLAKHPHDWFYFSEGHLHLPTLRSLEAYCKQVGLRMTQIKTHGYSSAPRLRATKAGWLHSRKDKIISMVAARMGWGHRLECMMIKDA